LRIEGKRSKIFRRKHPRRFPVAKMICAIVLSGVRKREAGLLEQPGLLDVSVFD
jgi:hypothetical protein